MKDFKEMKKTPLSMDNVFVLLWVVVLLSVMLVMILGQFLTTVLLCVAIVAYINKQSKSSEPKK